MKRERQPEFEDFVVSTTPRLFRTAWAITSDYQLAEDALQASYEAAYSKWRHVCRAEKPEAYVRRMVVNQVLGWRRRAWWSERASDSLSETLPGRSHEDAVVDTDLVWRSLRQLPVRQRAIVVLRYYEQLSEAEIADILSIRPGLARRLARGCPAYHVGGAGLPASGRVAVAVR